MVASRLGCALARTQCPPACCSLCHPTNVCCHLPQPLQMCALENTTPLFQQPAAPTPPLPPPALYLQHARFKKTISGDALPCHTICSF